MSERDEKLSALMDNALEHREVGEYLQDLKRDALADAERLQRYQIIRDVIRDDLSQISMLDISAAVQRAVELEPETDTAPQIKPVASWFNLAAWSKPLTGMAIAASVAMVTVVAVRTVNTGEQDIGAPALVEANGAGNAANSAVVTPINPAIAQHVRAASTDAGRQSALRNHQLSEYMLNHSGYAGQTSVQGMIPYVRVVNFETEAKR